MIDTALILAAGLGTRLAPLSGVRAKAALPVAGDVLIRRQVRWLAAAGVRQVIVNLHHLPATVTSALGGGEDLGVAVRYSWEPHVLGSAGGPRQAFDLTDAPRLLIVNGDTLSDLDLGALVAEHARTQPLVTMAACDHARAGYSSLLVNASGALAGVARADAAPAPAAATLRAVHFMGTQVAERRAFDDAPRDTPSETVRWLYPRLLAADPGSVRVWSSGASFFDVGTPEEYLRTTQVFAAREGRALDRGPGVEIDPTADVSGSVLWDGVRIGARAIVRECVLADGVVVPADTRLMRAAVVRRPSGVAPAAAGGLDNLLVVPFDGAPGRIAQP